MVLRYKFIQLKELPTSDIGTIYKCYGIKHLWDKGDCYEIVVNGHIEYATVGKTVLDDPKWFKKEIDFDALTDFKCPNCGGTKFHALKHCWNNRDMDSDDYGSHCIVQFECPCGHTWKW